MTFRIRTAALAAVLFTGLLALSATFGAGSADAARYVVAQCGWHVGQDAAWYDTSADRFMKSSYCQTPESADPFEGVHLLSQVKGSSKTVAGTRFATWRWQAPSGTGIVNVHGQRWQYLRDGFQHRIGGVVQGGFSPFLTLDASDGTKRDFGQGFSPYAQAFESRLVCYRQEDKLCDASGTIQAAVRSLTISIDDAVRPSAQMTGALTGSWWLRGAQSLQFSNGDVGAGLRFAETSVDGSVHARSEMDCAKTMISGQWRGTRMQPCPVASTGTHVVDTRGLADGPHVLRHCAIDFAGSVGCAADHWFRVDNNAPGAPRQLAVAGGDGWHRTNGFDLTWAEPDQGVAAPIYGSLHRLVGEGYRTDPVGSGLAGALKGVRVPGPGEHRIRVWLADQALNVDESHAVEATLRLDDVPPSGYFLDVTGDDPQQIRVPVSDVHSGVAGGSVSWMPIGGGEWEKLPGGFEASGQPMLTARIPADAPRGEWILRAEITDRAGNVTFTDRRANGSQMTVVTPLKDETAITAGFGEGRSEGSLVQVGYGERARIVGRLTTASSEGLADQELLFTEEPFPGSRRGAVAGSVRTDSRGDFELWLEPGPGRRIRFKFPGSRRLGESVSGPLEMRVSGRLRFKVKPKRLRTGQAVRFRGRILALDA